MTSLTTRAYLSARNHLTALKDRRDDQGASMLEYVGVLVLVALIVGAIFTLFGDGITDTITTAVTDSVNTIINQGE